MFFEDSYLNSEILLNLDLKDLLAIFSINNTMDKEEFWTLWLAKWYPNVIKKKTSAKEFSIALSKYKSLEEYVEDNIQIKHFLNEWQPLPPLLGDFYKVDKNPITFPFIDDVEIKLEKKRFCSYNEDLVSKIEKTKNKRLNPEIMDYFLDKNIDFLFNVDYCIWFLSHFKWPFESFKVYIYLWEAWFPFIEEPFFDELIILLDKNQIFRYQRNVDLFFGIGKRELMHKLGYLPTIEAIDCTVMLLSFYHDNGLIKEKKPLELKIMNIILELVQIYDLKINSDIYEKCILNFWFNGWRYFLDLNIKITSFDLTINKYKNNTKKWITMNEEIYEIIREKKLLEDPTILEIFKKSLVSD